MTFEQPMLLWGLLLLPLALLGYVLVQRRRARYAVRFTNLDLLASVVQRSPGWRRHVPAALYLAALGALLVSLGRPQATVPVPRDQATVMLVMDVSGSMDATDVSPNRLAAAKSSAKSFLDQLPDNFQVGLVTFSSTAQTMSMPTTDRSTLRGALESLRAGGGTAMGDGLVHALEVRQEAIAAAAAAATAQPTPPILGSRAGSRPATSATPAAQPSGPPPMAIVLLSDGANSAGQTDPLQAADQAQELGVPVFTIALGTPGGTVNLMDPRGMRRTIRVPPDIQTLEQIAEVSGGRFFAAPSDADLAAVYQDLGSRIGWVEEYQEVTVLFAGAALLLMAAGGALALVWFNRFP